MLPVSAMLEVAVHTMQEASNPHIYNALASVTVSTMLEASAPFIYMLPRLMLPISTM